ncbi:unnamed protein product [Gadus morhua 'NCC']
MEEVAPSNGRRYGLHTAGRARGEPLWASIASQATASALTSRERRLSLESRLIQGQQPLHCGGLILQRSDPPPPTAQRVSIALLRFCIPSIPLPKLLAGGAEAAAGSAVATPTPARAAPDRAVRSPSRCPPLGVPRAGLSQRETSLL